jgi:acyl-CoA reductase-like NAD-dependent aldehyde dehydrogenase
MTIESIDPATGQLIASFAEAGPPEAVAAVAAARAAQAGWTTLPPADRAAGLIRFGQIIAARSDEIVALIGRETGKIAADATAEVLDSASSVPYLLDSYAAVRPAPVPEPPFGMTTARLSLVPLGVVGLIMPWNFPFQTPVTSLVAALAAGNAVVLKPSEYATLTGRLIGALATSAGLPEGLVTLLNGGEPTGRALVAAGCDGLVFVGSVEGGQSVIAGAGVTPVQVELGGNSAALVLDDADLDLAAAGVAWGATYNSAQDCAGVKRVFVTAAVADAFLAKLVPLVAGLRAGDDYGPYIRPAARRVVEARVEAAVAAGARRLTGGDVFGFAWMTPSVLVEVDASSPLVVEETFGNVIPVTVVPDADAAVAASNRTAYGLSTAIFSADLDAAGRIADRLESGMVFVNDPFLALPGMEHWSGWKKSGRSQPGPRVEQFLRKRLVVTNATGKPREFWYGRS